jgi:predicted phosphate transport protein (TIGR00153 family)
VHIEVDMSLTRDEVFWSAFREHAARSVKAAAMLTELMEHPERAATLVPAIRDVEHEGDDITHKAISALHQTWITPLDREEIHALMSALDDVLDYIEAAAVRVDLYDITTSRSEAVELAQCLERCVADMSKAVGMLTNMKDPKPILDLCIAINEHEHDADEIYRRAIGKLFRERPDPLEVMKWRDVYEAIETSTDRAEDVANILEGIVLEHA